MRMIINVHDIRARRPVAPDCDTQRTVTHARGTPRRAQRRSQAVSHEFRGVSPSYA